MGASVLTPAYHRAGGTLQCEEVSLARIANAVGTPAFVYSLAAVRSQFQCLTAALQGVRHRLHYSVKANSALALLAELRALGAGVDIVSGGELHRALAAGFSGADVVFSGVGKTAAEMRQALRADVAFFNVESEGELQLLDAVAAEEGAVARVALRVNPEVEVETPHTYTRTGGRGHKFGIPYDEIAAVAQQCASLPHVQLVGLDMHVGSQLTRMAPYEQGIGRLLELLEVVRPLAGDALQWLDIGGGLAVPYERDDAPVELASFAEVARVAAEQSGLPLVIEPGRFLVANAGVLLTRVLYRKRSGGKDYAIVDAGMTELLRPSHYQAHHRVEPVQPPALSAPVMEEGAAVVDVVGPVCESGDFLALDRALGAIAPGDLLAVCSAGAYGYVMSSNYNSRPRVPEVLVDGRRFGVVTARETYDDLIRLERVVPVWEE